jgi:hypothetical protein
LLETSEQTWTSKKAEMHVKVFEKTFELLDFRLGAPATLRLAWHDAMVFRPRRQPKEVLVPLERSGRMISDDKLTGSSIFQ